MRFICIKSRTDNAAALELAKQHSPNIEIIDETTLIFDLTGRTAVPDSRKIAELNGDRFLSISVADNLAASIMLANRKAGVSFACREELSQLANLPLSALETKRDFTDLMAVWGIYNLEEFCQLPVDEMVSRFGPEIINYRKTARAESFKPFNWNVKQDEFSWETELQGEIETLEPLQFILSRGLSEIFRKLDHAGLSAQTARIILYGRDFRKSYRVKVVFPNKKEKIWIKQILNKVESDPPGVAIDKVSLSFTPCKPRTVQNDLFSGVVLEPENLDLIVGKIKKFVGLEEIGIPVLKDSWTKGFAMDRELSPLLKNSFSEIKTDESVKTCLYYFPEAIKTKLYFEKGSPKSLFMQGNRFNIVKAGGPWRKMTDWFEPDNRKRDEWDLQTESGAVYRAYIEENGEVFVEGGYD